MEFGGPKGETAYYPRIWRPAHIVEVPAVTGAPGQSFRNDPISSRERTFPWLLALVYRARFSSIGHASPFPQHRHLPWSGHLLRSGRHLTFPYNAERQLGHGIWYCRKYSAYDRHTLCCSDARITSESPMQIQHEMQHWVARARGASARS